MTSLTALCLLRKEAKPSCWMSVGGNDENLVEKCPKIKNQSCRVGRCELALDVGDVNNDMREFDEGFCKFCVVNVVFL